MVALINSETQSVVAAPVATVPRVTTTVYDVRAGRQVEQTVPVPEPAASSGPPARGLWEQFHLLWGQSKDGVYDKNAWKDLQALIQRAEGR